MKKIFYVIMASLAVSLFVSCKQKPQDIKVMQLNLWMTCREVPGAFQGTVELIKDLDPDLVALCEASYDNYYVVNDLVDTLKSLGITYYTSETSDASYLSKYPILETNPEIDASDNAGAIWRMLTEINGRKVAFYSGHLDYRNYACYDARGYDGWTWEKSEIAPSVEFIMEKNNRSDRDEQIRDFIAKSKADIDNGYAVLVCGDFNEPSHLDWTEATKDKFDHNGFVVPWTCSVELYNAGFKDAYRVMYPDPVTHPGISYPSDNALIEPSHLTWAPEVDERDRIDYIYYYPRDWFTVKDMSVLGPSSSIVRNARQAETGQDKFIEPSGVWPTDHKGMFAVFTIK